MAYNRDNAVAYAHKWAFKRNPRYLNFTGIGGDCTNFISQCLLAGGAKMNYKKTFGWYYNSANDRTPSWTGVQYFYNFLINNKGVGPYAELITMDKLLPGDVIQLSFVSGTFGHSLLVVSVGAVPSLDNILIATHTDDSDNRPLSTYSVIGYRFLKINCR